MKRADVVAGVERMRKIMPENRLRRHLERCALEYGCPAGKNFFLRRYEAPLPTSQACNARCLGCISLQQDSGIACSQNRIDFTPDPEEIAQVALAHIEKVRNSVVSFGQGCEGDPLLAAHVIQPAIEMIRAGTGRGTINMNTNGSMPDVLKRLFSAGLDSIRVSMNSVRPDCYAAYFRPVSYEFSDVIRSIDMALEMGKFVSINYLNLPGFTDSPEEVSALTNFLETHRVSQIQWRNLNYDPLLYWNAMNQAAQNGPPMGMHQAVEQVRRRFPEIMHGYFNPPREKWAFGLRHVKPFKK
jgi:pyruvate-formate lyase-activating enzyme